MKILKRNIIIYKPKIFIISLVAITLLSSCNLFTKSSESTPVKTDQIFSNYINSTFKIKIIYPADWEKTENQHPDLLITDFSTPKGLDAVAFEIVIENLSTKSINTLEGITQEKLDELKSHNVKVTISEPSTLSNTSAYKVVFIVSGTVLTTQIMEIWTVKNNYSYKIMVMGEPNRYSFYSNVIQEMVDSFEIY